MTHTSPNPVQALATAQAVQAAMDLGTEHLVLRDWFTASHDGDVAPIPGGYLIKAHGYAFRGLGRFDVALAEWVQHVVVTTLPDPLAAFVARMAGLMPVNIANAMELATIASGGTWYVPGDEHWAPSHYAEASLFGVYAAGSSRAELAQNWIKAARRQLAGRVAA